jgi:hypothetical protein
MPSRIMTNDVRCMDVATIESIVRGSRKGNRGFISCISRLTDGTSESGSMPAFTRTT